MDINAIKKELEVFKVFNFEEEPHIYWWLDENGERKQARISMTALIEKYGQKFDLEKIASNYARRNRLKVEDVKAEWQFSNDFSKVKGTHIHAFNEYLWQGLEYNYPREKVIEQLGFDALEPVWKNLKKIALKFYEEYHDRIVPVGLELVVGDKDIGICGSIDFLAYSKKLKRLIIIDYKSNKGIKKESFKGQKMKGILSHLDDCNYIHYSLQLNGYQYILQKNTPLRLNNKHFLIWMNENNDDYVIYETKDLYKEAEMMLKEFKENDRK